MRPASPPDCTKKQMRAAIPAGVVWVILLAGCASSDVAGGRSVVFHHANGQPAAEGRFTTHEWPYYIVAQYEKRDPAPWKEYLRVGRWRYWHANGALRAEITYAIGQYAECCVAGPCRGRYERVVGTPRVFNADGTPVTLARAPKRARISTNCEGGAVVFRPSYVLPEDLAPEWNSHEPSAQ